MDRMIFQGETALGNLKEQNSMLKEVKRKILSVANTLGLSGNLFLCFKNFWLYLKHGPSPIFFYFFLP